MKYISKKYTVLVTSHKIETCVVTYSECVDKYLPPFVKKHVTQLAASVGRDSVSPCGLMQFLVFNFLQENFGKISLLWNLLVILISPTLKKKKKTTNSLATN